MNQKNNQSINANIFEHQDSKYKIELYEIEDVILNKKSAKQFIQILRLKEFGKSLIMDGHFQITDFSNKPYHELLSVASSVFIEVAKPKYLICGGGDGVTMSRLFIVNPNAEIDLVEYDDEVIRISKKYLNDWNNNIFNIEHGNIFIEDAVQFIQRDKPYKYDSIICDITPPHSGCDSTFWTVEFLKDLKKSVFQNGNIIMLGEHIDIKNSLNKDFLVIAEDLFKTVFPLVNPFTGSCFFYMSDTEISFNSFTKGIMKIKPAGFSYINNDSILSALYTGKALLN